MRGGAAGDPQGAGASWDAAAGLDKPVALPAGAVVVVTGATGQLGRALLERIVGIGTQAGPAPPLDIELRTLSRRPLPPELATLSRGVVVHTCADIRSLAARDAIAGADLVFHLAARVWPGPRTGSREEMRSVNVDGTLNVLAARPKSVVFASSAAVYGAWPDNPLPLEEACRPRPNAECPYALDKLSAEQAVTGCAQRWAVLRFCAVLGRHADRRVVRSFAGYRLAVPEMNGCAQALQWLDEDDAVQALLSAGADLLGPGRASGQVLNIATQDWLSALDMAGLSGSRVLRAPRRLVLTVAEVGRRARLSPFGADRAVLISGPLALSPARAGEVVQWRPTRASREVFTRALARRASSAPLNR